MNAMRFADSYELNIDNVSEAILSQVCEKENVDFCSEETNLRIHNFEERIENIMALDESLKTSLVNDLQLTICFSTADAFENVLRIGLSLLKALITAELPEIRVVHCEPIKIERRCTPVQEPSELDPTLMDYMKKVLPYLKEEQKLRLQGRMEAMFEMNRNEPFDLF